MARILVVDDEPLIAMMAEDWLDELGHETVGPANDLETGLNLARSEIDAAVIDVSLGRDRGYGIADILMGRDIPFVFATGHSRPIEAERYKSVATLLKPFEFEDFKHAIQSMLSESCPWAI